MTTLLAHHAFAAPVSVFFTGTVDGVANPESTFIVEGDFVQGSFSYDSEALVTIPPGEYVNVITDLYVEIIQDDGNGGGIAYLVIDNETGDIFVGSDEVSFFYGPPPLQLGNNFNISLTNGPSLNNSLLDATNQMIAAGFGVIYTMFNDGYGTIDNEYTSGNVNFIVDFLEVTSVNSPLTGDLNGDGFVGIADLNIVLGNWNQNVSPGVWLDGDPSGDGFVGIADLNTVLGNWNAGTPPSGSAAVPEPGSLALLAGLIAGAVSRQRPACPQTV
ncbi:MAG: PEP-CTERM sorting domain-containing protein [Phycisphaerales bacterium]